MRKGRAPTAESKIADKSRLAALSRHRRVLLIRVAWLEFEFDKLLHVIRVYVLRIMLTQERKLEYDEEMMIMMKLRNPEF